MTSPGSAQLARGAPPVGAAVLVAGAAVGVASGWEAAAVGTVGLAGCVLIALGCLLRRPRPIGSGLVLLVAAFVVADELGSIPPIGAVPWALVLLATAELAYGTAEPRRVGPRRDLHRARHLAVVGGVSAAAAVAIAVVGTVRAGAALEVVGAGAALGLVALIVTVAARPAGVARPRGETGGMSPPAHHDDEHHIRPTVTG